MKSATKAWIVAGALVLLGCVVFVCVMTALKWDFTKLSTVEYETNITEITETFDNISISTETADVVFALSDDGACSVECYEDKKAKHAVTVENDTLVVKVDNQKSWYDYIGFCFGSQKVTVYLPKAEYSALSVDGLTGNVEIAKDYSFESVDISLTTGNVDFCAAVTGAVKVKTSTGNIDVKNNTVGALAITATTGNVRVSDVTCKGAIAVDISTGNVSMTDVSCDSISSKGTTGNTTLNNVIVIDNMSIERSLGDIKLSKCDAADIYLQTSTGNVTGSLLSEKVFVTHTDRGTVRVPETTSGGKCKITTSSGNIVITID